LGRGGIEVEGKEGKRRGNEGRREGEEG